jgi:anti-anti-sigma factor
MADSYTVAQQLMLPTGYVVVPLSGEVDIFATAEVGAALARAATQARTGAIADLSGLTFIDASGLGALIRAHQRSCHLPGGLRVAGAPASMRRLLEVTHLDSYLNVFPTVTAAVRHSG